MGEPTTCPQCGIHYPMRSRVCDCGYRFPQESGDASLQKTASLGAESGHHSALEGDKLGAVPFDGEPGSFFAVAGLAVRGLFGSKETLQGMSKLIGTKNPTIARIICLVAVLPFAALGIGAIGVSVYEGAQALRDLTTSEQTKVEAAVRDGLREKTGRVPDRVSLIAQGGGKYAGTASLGAETWDVTAAVSSSEVKWEAQSREAKALEALRTRVKQEILAAHPGSAIMTFSLDKYEDGICRGSVTTTGILDSLEPERKLPNGKSGFTRSLVVTWDLEVDKSGTRWNLLSPHRKK